MLGRWAVGAPVRRKRRRGPRPRYAAAIAASGLRVPSHDSLWRFATYGGALGDDRRRTDRRIASAEGAGLEKRSDPLRGGFECVETTSKGSFFLLRVRVLRAPYRGPTGGSGGERSGDRREWRARTRVYEQSEGESKQDPGEMAIGASGFISPQGWTKESVGRNVETPRRSLVSQSSAFRAPIS